MNRLAHEDAPTLRLQTLRRLLAHRPAPVALPTSTSLALLRTILSSTIGVTLALVDDEGRLEGTIAYTDLQRTTEDSNTRDVMIVPEIVMLAEEDPATARAALLTSGHDRVLVVTASGSLLGVLHRSELV